jgi:hypothetical protein
MKNRLRAADWRQAHDKAFGAARETPPEKQAVMFALVEMALDEDMSLAEFEERAAPLAGALNALRRAPG